MCCKRTHKFVFGRIIKLWILYPLMKSWDRCDCSVIYINVRRRWTDRFCLSLHFCFSGFLTGFRRVPILGMNQIQMKIRGKHIFSSVHDQHFPESLTCHCILELPCYSTKEIMRDRLIAALNPERGFLDWGWRITWITTSRICIWKRLIEFLF